jgi:hypothetical protein
MHDNGLVIALCSDPPRFVADDEVGVVFRDSPGRWAAAEKRAALDSWAAHVT